MVKEAISPAASVRPFQVLILEPDHKLGAEIVSTLQEAVPGTISAMARSVRTDNGHAVTTGVHTN